MLDAAQCSKGLIVVDCRWHSTPEGVFLVVKYTQSLVTIQKDGATKVHEAFLSPFAHLNESFLDSSVVRHGNDVLR